MRAYERFLNYVKVWTTSDRESLTHPSTECQFQLAHLLVEEMKSIGMTDAYVDEHCYVYGHLPATPGCESVPALGFISHLDTSMDAPGKDVHPVLHENYSGGPIQLPATGEILDPEEFPAIRNLIGQTVITSDGTTLLGADDKAGIAEIMTVVERLNGDKIPHGTICVAFTPDEEIGAGAKFFDTQAFGADVAYTLDGDDVGEFSYENFNGATAVVTITGRGIHPGSAKNVMVNAQNVAMEFHAALPMAERPEYTEERQGFYHLYEMRGTVNQARLTYLVRDHDRAGFARKKARLTETAGILNERYGAGIVAVELQDSYYNMEEIIRGHWEMVERAHKAIELAGLTPIDVPVRGGTDGAMISYMGLPCPNIGTGGYNWHSVKECISVEGMDRVVEIVLHLVELYRNGGPVQK